MTQQQVKIDSRTYREIASGLQPGESVNVKYSKSEGNPVVKVSKDANGRSTASNGSDSTVVK